LRAEWRRCIYNSWYDGRFDAYGAVARGLERLDIGAAWEGCIDGVLLRYEEGMN